MHPAHCGKAAAGSRRRSRIFFARVVAVASALTLAGAAAAAPGKDKRVEPPKPVLYPMRVLVVTDSRPGCAPSCAEWISAQGQITMETPAQFQRVFKALGHKKLPIFISSPGGAVVAALAIGREIRKRGLDVALERTVFEKCEQATTACDLRALKDGDKGRPEPIGAQCASSCVLILAAGAERVVPVYGFVGVHQHFATQTTRHLLRTYQVQRRFENGRIVEQRRLIAEKQLSSTTVEKDPDYAPVRAYFTEMGVNTAAIMPLLLGTSHRDIHRMTADERRATRLVTRVATGDTLLQSARAADPKPESAEPIPVALPSVAAEMVMYYPPGGDTVDLFVRLKPASGPLRPAQFTADVALAEGRKLSARSTGEGLADPLYVAFALEDFCALRRGGDLSMKVALTSDARPGMTLHISADLAKTKAAADYAAKRCSN
jgi:hypothetical protein